MTDTPPYAPRYTISVLCMNHLAVTQRCIESVLRHSGESYELYVTDNASSDGTGMYLKELKRRVGEKLHVVANDVNKGFQEPNAFVLTKARGEFLVLLNNDMVVCEGWLEKLAEPFEANHKVAITGPPGAFTRVSADWRATHGLPADYIEGSCLMIPVALARRHGLWSRYLTFAYFEDTDLNWRMRELGYEIATVAMPMRHEHPGTTSKDVDLSEVHAANKQAMQERWGFHVRRKTFVRRVLVRRMGARGDVLLSTPALRALRLKWPLAEVDVVTHDDCAMMLRGFDGVKLATHKRSHYDVFYDLDRAYESRPEVHIVQAFADALEVVVPKRWQLEMFPTDEEGAWGLRKSRGARVALVHGGVTTWPSKNWPVERMEEVVRRLREAGYFTIAVGDKQSPVCGADDSIAGKCTPQAMYALARHAALFVGIDSMPQHVASAAGTPSVVLFGPTNPRCIVRPTPFIIPLQVSTDVAPCAGEHGRRKKAITQSPCGGECINALTVEHVMRAVRKLEGLGGGATP